MKIYLNNDLAEHRRGRFLTAQLNAVAMGDELPAGGVVLMIGKDFQALHDEAKEVYWQWCRRPGRTLLLLPPYVQGGLCKHLDWQLTFRAEPAELSGTPIADKVAAEVSYQLTGQDGECNRSAGHQWPDYSVNTRYVKQHSATGVFAATCLPLWSIALLDQSEVMRSWLSILHQLAGKPADARTAEVAEVEACALGRDDYGLMVCIYGWRIGDPEDLVQALQLQTVPVISLQANHIREAIPRLRSAGYLSDDGLSERGLLALQSSPYWGYAARLREEVA